MRQTETELKTDVDILELKKESLLKEIEQLKALYNQEFDKRMADTRVMERQLIEARAKLKTDTAEFERLLKELVQQKTVFQKEKELISDERLMIQAKMDKVGIFVRLVREGAKEL